MFEPERTGRRLLTVSQVGDAVGKCDRSVYNMLNDGVITAIKVGRSTRIWEAEVERYLASRPAYAPRIAA